MVTVRHVPLLQFMFRSSASLSVCCHPVHHSLRVLNHIVWRMLARAQGLRHRGRGATQCSHVPRPARGPHARQPHPNVSLHLFTLFLQRDRVRLLLTLRWAVIVRALRAGNCSRMSASCSRATTSAIRSKRIFLSRCRRPPRCEWAPLEPEILLCRVCHGSFYCVIV